MVTEIIEILEYLLNSPVLKATIILWAGISIIILIVCIAIFTVVVKSFFDIHKWHRRK